MTDVLPFITDLAERTGALLKDYSQRPTNSPRYKQDRTLLTEADLASNEFVTAAIRVAFPHDHILSEEEDTTFPGDSRPTWVIDPLDGTTNFDRGLHYWGISIARVVEGRPHAAALCFPMISETFTAIAGKGAWLNGKPLTVPPADSHLVSFFLCDSRINRQYSARIKYKPRILGSAAYNFCAVAKGLAVIGFESIPKIWDIAASWLILTETGGVLHPLKGPVFPMQAGKDYAQLAIPLVGAANKNLLEEAVGNIDLH